eukprot:gene4274-8502_t
MASEFLEAVLACVNEVRLSAELSELSAIEESDINNCCSNEITILEDVENGKVAASGEFILNALQRILASDQDADEQTNTDYRHLLNSGATHLAASMEIYGDSVAAKILVVSKYLELDPVGPLIGGDIVLQGTIISLSHGPSLCRVEFLGDNEEEFSEIQRIPPWDMMIASGENEGDHGMFTIPISLGTNYQYGALRILIYVDEMDKIPLSSTEEEYDPNFDDMICTIDYSTRAADETDNVNVNDTRIVTNITMLSPTLESESDLDRGFQPAFMRLTKNGMKHDKKCIWPLQMYVSYGSIGSDGIEDIVWVRTPKHTGMLPEVPPGFTTTSEMDFSSESDEYAANLAVKIGSDAVFTNIFMVTLDTKSRIDAERYIARYLQQVGGGEYRPAPSEVCNALDGHMGGILMMTGSEGAHVISMRSTDDSDALGGDGRLPPFEQITAAAAAAAGKEKARQQNADQQKKVAALMARLGRDAGSRAVEATDADTANADNTSEKENHFLETLQYIHEGRTKLSRQQSEFDQLALDLQTRLDDKEFRASEIAESFKEFKQEILQRAEHSRTGKGVSQRFIKVFEQADSKKDEDLEKVRLRHISLRTALRKLEKNLRAREQLAEGLHMIDFEQLKIENQTLNEKIEERNEELAKLKRKKTVTVQVLTHIREKLRFIERNNDVLRNELEDLDHTVAKQRNFLNTYKHEKDGIRTDNTELKRRQGFATNDMLTTDYEKRKGTMDTVKASIKELQERHFLLTRQITVNKNKSRSMNFSAEFSLPDITSKTTY